MKTIVWFWFVLGALSAAGEVYVAEVGKKATLNCGVMVFRSNLEWRKNNVKIISQSYTGFTSKGNSEISKRSRIKQDIQLEISSVIETDAGEFTCTADRSTHTHTLVVVRVWIEPSANLEVGSKVTLHCQAKGLDPSPTVQWQGPDGSLSASVLDPVAVSHDGTWQCVVTIKEKKFLFSQSLSVRAFETTTSTTPPKSQKPKDNKTVIDRQPDVIMRPFLGLKLWVWIALGVGCLVLILLIIFVIIMCTRIRRKKKKFLRIKHAQQSQRPKKYCQCHHQTAAAKPQQGRRREKPSALPLQAY
ncbi:CD4-2 molecule, tandem duplicate 1 isoform 2-T2 [Odontesthes bonariensis]|uniref:CD4-2 molecule, tandem duplicate 1 isoform X2 n=1 Tax=Odontesthes bonariensis TaxID=219752 RepID=UPI003F58A8DF